jgi:hypothetical protein
MDELYYLEAAEQMGWSIFDFAIPDQEFARYFVFELYRPQLLKRVRAFTGFSQWKALTEILRQDEQAVMAELEACLRHANGFTAGLTLEQQVAYIQTNEYAFFLYDRLAKYVDAFWFDFQLNQEDEYYDL